MCALLRRNDLAARCELDVLDMVVPWAAVHSSAELMTLLPSLRLFAVPAPQLKALLQHGGLLASLRHEPGMALELGQALQWQLGIGAGGLGGALGAGTAAAVELELVCPITAEVFDDPVVAADGFTYERAAIERWLRQKQASPMTNLPLLTAAVHTNHTVRKLLSQRAEAEKAVRENFALRMHFDVVLPGPALGRLGPGPQPRAAQPVPCAATLLAHLLLC